MSRARGQDFLTDISSLVDRVKTLELVTFGDDNSAPPVQDAFTVGSISVLSRLRCQRLQLLTYLLPTFFLLLFWLLALVRCTAHPWLNVCEVEHRLLVYLTLNLSR